MRYAGRARFIVVFLGILALLAGTAAAQATGRVGIQMRQVRLRMQNDVVLEIRSLRGELEGTDAGQPVTFDDSRSFVVKVDSGEIAISARSLTQLLNTYVFAYAGAPLKRVTVSFEGDRVKQKGTMHKGVDLPFEMEGTVSTTPEGNIRLHADKIRSAHLPVKGLLHLFGKDLSELVNVNEARGVKIEGDDIILYPSRMSPPPHINGKVVKVYVRDGKLVQLFDSGAKPAPLKPPVPAFGYIYHNGGVLRFGKLTMADSDLQLIGSTPNSPFEFCLYDYNRQLVAGYSKNTAVQGLVVHMPNYSELKRGVSRAALR